MLVLLAALPLAACGFAPAYGPAGVATKLQASIAFDPPTDRNAFDFVERLEQRLGRPRSECYALAYTIRTRAIGVGISQANAITRFNVTGQVGYRLTDLASGAELTAGSVENFTSYSASGTTVSTLSAERDANARLMRILADQIVTRLIATAGTWPEPGAPA